MNDFVNRHPGKVVLGMLLGIAIMSCAMIFAGASKREQTYPAFDTSLIPTQEAALTKITISDDNDHTLDLTQLSFSATILLVRADGNFHEGSAVPTQANDLWRDSGVVWSVPVSGQNTWHFKRQSGAGTVNIYIKALGSN